MRILRESSLEGEKIRSIFDVEFEELVGGTSGRDQQLGGYLSLPLWRKIQAGGKDLRDVSIRNHRGAWDHSCAHQDAPGLKHTLKSG